jgi:hypothetical protein
MFYVVLNEIGRSLWLCHLFDSNSIMYPTYINKSYNGFNFTFESGPIDENLIKTMNSKHNTLPPNITSTLLSTKPSA